MQDNQQVQVPSGEQPPADNEPEIATSDTATSGVDNVPGLEKQLRKIELQAAEHHDAWLRAKAETENVRRRAQEDVAKAAKFAIEKFAAELLGVKDSLEQTLAVENAAPETIREGVELTLRNLVKAFEKGGVEEVSPLGAKFDPHKHQAISALASEQPANTVIQVFQKGYLLEGRVLRPALVAVSSGPAT